MLKYKKVVKKAGQKMKLTYEAYAKINLILDVTGVKKNGYHTIFSVMQSIGLSDVITVEKTKGEKITISCTDETVPTDSKNIVYKCAVKFFEYFEIKKNKGIHIHIEKNIPHEAGLGGGSADGAAVLVALNEIFNTNASKNANSNSIVSIINSRHRETTIILPLRTYVTATLHNISYTCM